MASIAHKSQSSAATKEVIFKDLDIAFNAHPVTKTVGTLTNERAISRALRNLILTNKYERFYNPLYGGNVRSKLFELFTPGMRAALSKRIEQTIQSFEPRAQLVSVNVHTNDDQNALSVSIVYIPVNRGNPAEVNISLERIR